MLNIKSVVEAVAARTDIALSASDLEVVMDEVCASSGLPIQAKSFGFREAVTLLWAYQDGRDIQFIEKSDGLDFRLFKNIKDKKALTAFKEVTVEIFDQASEVKISVEKSVFVAAAKFAEVDITEIQYKSSFAA